MMSPALRAYVTHGIAFAGGIAGAWVALSVAGAVAGRAPGGVPLYLLGALALAAALVGFGIYVVVLARLLKVTLSAGWISSGAGAVVVLVLLALYAIWGGWLTPLEAVIVLLILWFGIGGAAAKRLSA